MSPRIIYSCWPEFKMLPHPGSVVIQFLFWSTFSEIEWRLCWGNCSIVGALLEEIWKTSCLSKPYSFFQTVETFHRSMMYVTTISRWVSFHPYLNSIGPIWDKNLNRVCTNIVCFLHPLNLYHVFSVFIQPLFSLEICYLLLQAWKCPYVFFLFLCPLFRRFGNGGAACSSCLDCGPLPRNPHHCGQSRQQKAQAVGWTATQGLWTASINLENHPFLCQSSY